MTNAERIVSLTKYLEKIENQLDKSNGPKKEFLLREIKKTKIKLERLK